MMQVTFLAHSGFLVELDSLCLLFDYWKGDLPPIPPKPLLVCASHAHEDHFNPAVFALDDGVRDICFLLGKDIHLNPARREKWGISEATFARCHRLGGNQRLEVSGAVIETLPSTDAGVAFLVHAEGKTILHAGDLNWWHWEGEPDPWNPDMERDFKAYTEPLTGRTIDLAMLPLDPRLGEDGFRGPRYILEQARVERFLPMHLWGKFGFTEQFLSRYPQFRQQTMAVEREGQVFTL